MNFFKSSRSKIYSNGKLPPSNGSHLHPPLLPMAFTGDAAIDAINQVEPHLISLHTPEAFETEQYRMLGHRIEQLHRDKGLNVMAVSSPTMGDGKTTTVLNMAGVLSQTSGMRLLVIETDLRRPALEHFLGLENARTRSLVDAILEPALALKDVITWCTPFNFAVLPAGRPITSHYELLSSPRLGELIDDARQEFDCIIIDTPPLIPFSDCRSIAKWIDGFLIVVNAHKTPRTALARAIEVLEPNKIVGLIFNQDDNVALGSYAHYYYNSPRY